MSDFDVTETLPFALSARTTSAASYAAEGKLVDVTIGALPFQLAIDDEHPYTRQTIEGKKQQIDTSTEPGEQTLSAWWVRDQDSWHRGSGINFYEPGTDPFTRYRFAGSQGVDIWTQGQVSLLHKTELGPTASAGEKVGCAAAVRSGTNVAYYTTPTAFGYFDTSAHSISLGGVAPATGPVIAGSKVLFGTTGGIYAATIGSEAATLAALYSPGLGSVVRPWWVKSRIVASRDNELYDVALGGGSAWTALYVHPDSGWTWSAVTETPDAILAAGYSSGYSAIYAFTLATSGSAGAVPTLGPAYVVAEFPPGEEVYSLKSYLSAFVAIGTARGVRIGLIGTGGKIEYGPLTVETTKPVRTLAARDSFVYAGIEADLDGLSGCARINLAEEITSQVGGIGYNGASTLRFAWAYDVSVADAPVIDSICFVGNTDQVCLGAREVGLYVTGSDYVASGYVRSGKIRFGTAEPKVFPRAKVRIECGDDSKATLYTVDYRGTETNVIEMTNTFNTDQDISLTSISEAPQAHAALKVTLTASTDGATSPVLQVVQMKALPAPNVQREIRYPLALHDVEQDRNSRRYGYTGFAAARLAELELLEESSTIVQITDNTAGESYPALIKAVQFLRDTPPGRNTKNFGGRLLVICQKVT